MLRVKLDGMLDGGVADNVAMGEVLGEDTGTGLLLLCNVVRLALSVGGTVGGILLVGMGTRHGDVVGAKLGVVEQKSRLHGRLLLKSNIGALGLALGGELNVGNLATSMNISTYVIGSLLQNIGSPEAEEVLDLIVTGGRSNVRDVDSSHCRRCWYLLGI